MGGAEGSVELWWSAGGWWPPDLFGRGRIRPVGGGSAALAVASAWCGWLRRGGDLLSLGLAWRMQAGGGLRVPSAFAGEGGLLLLGANALLWLVAGAGDGDVCGRRFPAGGVTMSSPSPPLGSGGNPSSLGAGDDGALHQFLLEGIALEPAGVAGQWRLASRGWEGGCSPSFLWWCGRLGVDGGCSVVFSGVRRRCLRRCRAAICFPS